MSTDTLPNITQQPDFLSELNTVQREATVNYQGPCLIIAGAGSGKTRVLTYRIAYMLSQGIDPHRILALTFTNKAAREMKARIATLVGNQSARRLWMGTFHSIFARILRAESEHIGYTSTFTIYDTSDSRSLIRSIIKEMELDEKAYKVNDVHARISLAKNYLYTAQTYAASATLVGEDVSNRKPKISEIFTLYSAKCKRANAMDFDDLLLNMNILLRDAPAVLSKYQQLFSYILVDEYQDTNKAQYLIVKRLAEAHNNLCVVGDDAQSIYSFRGASIENILNFRNDYPNYKEFKLEQNYRSTQTIVNAANSLIAKNTRQLRKHCFSEGETGEKVGLIKAFTDQEEGFMVAAAILETIYNDRADYNDFAILYRTNAQSRIFEDALRKKNIPYKIYGGLSFYQRAEIKDVLAYLRLIVNHNDDEAFKRIVNYPARGIGDTTLTRLQMAASAMQLSLWETVKQVSPEAIGVRPATLAKLHEFTSLIERFVPRIYTDEAYDFAFAVVQGAGILTVLKEEKTHEAIAKYENVEELLNSIREYADSQKAEQEDLEVTIAQYLENVALITDADNEKAEDRNKVSLMTVHAAKGLEFKYVYIVGLEDNLFPGTMAMFSPVELEEERRLFYVALTRAERKATVSFAHTRYRWGNLVSNPPSRFVREIDPDYLQNAESLYNTKQKAFEEDEDENNVTNDDNNSFIEKKPAVKTTIVRKSPFVKKASTPTNENFVADDANDIEAGMQVEHERFGFGEVLQVEGALPDKKAIVNFTGAGQKTLLLKFAKLRIVR